MVKDGFLVQLVTLLAVVMIIILVEPSAFADSDPSRIIPAVKVSLIPTQDEFLSKDKSQLLKDYEHFTMIRENGEKIDSYYLYTSGSQEDLVMLFYFEDKTYYSLEYYRPFNSDYFVLHFDTQYIYSERNGKGCMFPEKYWNDFWAGNYNTCEGGAAVAKKTENGWAVYVKFFDRTPISTANGFHQIAWAYGDIQEVKDNVPTKLKRENWPIRDYATIEPTSKDGPKILQANSGKITVDDFLYKPFEDLTIGLEKNFFPCANETLNVVTDSEQYDATNHVATIIVKINSETPPSTFNLRILDNQGKGVYQASQKSENNKDLVFTVDLSPLGNDIFSASVESGIKGQKGEARFSMGTIAPQKQVSDKCYFYLTYDKTSKNLSVLANLKDSSDNQIDHVQIFVDRKGDGVKELNSDDLTYIIDKERFGAYLFKPNVGWLTGIQHEEIGEGRIRILPNSYQVLINVPDVSENFKFALEQIVYADSEPKASRYPQNSFSTVPSSWAGSFIGKTSPKKFAADKWLPAEILTRQNVEVNLILVGDNWKPSLQNKIEKQLQTTFSPLILTELSKAGIQHSYKYNFISTSEQTTKELFEFMKKEATDVKPFFGQEDFKEPWGIVLWIKNNHTEWVDNSFERFKVEYKLIDADKMQDYIQQNIIAKDPKLNGASSANLVFISDGMDKVNFLHNYWLRKYDSAQTRLHDAVGLMGFGGRYNFYFFDLYAVPWHTLQGFPLFYDKKLENYATDLHDIKTEDRYARLISDYTNNATSLIITPSYLYPPVYKKHYVLDLVIVHNPENDPGSIINLIDSVINKDKIKSQLESLVPYSDWGIKLTVEELGSRNLPNKLKEVIRSAKRITPYEQVPSYTIDLLDSKKLSKELAQWATTRSSSDLRDFRDIQKSSWTIPVILVMTGSGRPIYIDFDGEIGVATPNPNDPTQPCCALGVTNADTVWTKKISATDLVLHEVGHVMSFMHPFQGFTSQDRPFYNQYFNWYASVMAYNSPPNGCGWWYSYLVDSKNPKGCGISDTIFTNFEKENFGKGIANYLIKAAKVNVYRIMLSLEKNGKDPNNLPDDVKRSVDGIQSKLDQAENSFIANQILSKDGAIESALDAALESENLAKKYNIIYEPSIKRQAESIQIPDWIKSTAKWWSTSAITDSDFVNSIQYLIKERIIVIPNVPESAQPTNQKIPAWVKTNAGWWADGKISDSDFVSGIQYLISNGIMKI